MDQDIIEKKPSSPVETTLLALAATFMIGAIVLMGMEIAELGHGENTMDKAASAYAREALGKGKKSYIQTVKKLELASFVNRERDDEEE